MSRLRGWFQSFRGNDKSEMSYTVKEKISIELANFEKAVEIRLREIQNAPCDMAVSSPQGSVQDENVYNFTHPKRGLAVIINNEKFGYVKNLGERHGSSEDARALYNTFRLLGFQVLQATDLTAQKIVILLQTVAKKYDHMNSDCFACAILSHGDETHLERDLEKSQRKDILYGVDGETVSTDVITELFNDQRCPFLKGKPRLFFFQACRGNELDAGVSIQILSDGDVKPDSRNVSRKKAHSSSVDPPGFGKRKKDEVEARKDAMREPDVKVAVKEQSELNPVVVSPAPLYKDCLVMYATPPGHFAWRRGTGSWFIQSLCLVLKSDAVRFGSIDLQKALIHAARNVALEYTSNMPDNEKFHAKKESPVLYSMLVKDIYYNVTGEESMEM